MGRMRRTDGMKRDKRLCVLNETGVTEYDVGMAISTYLFTHGIPVVELSKRIKSMSYVSLGAKLRGKNGLYVEDYFDICHALGVSADTFYPFRGENNGE